MENKQIHELAASLKQYSIDCRRKVHRFAEVAAHEVKTSAFIQQEIQALGLPYEKVSTTGLLAALDVRVHILHCAAISMPCRLPRNPIT